MATLIWILVNEHWDADEAFGTIPRCQCAKYIHLVLVLVIVFSASQGLTTLFKMYFFKCNKSEMINPRCNMP